MQEKKGGWPPIVKVGYRKPKKVRNLHFSHKSGILEEFSVNNLSELELALPHKHVVRIGGNVGLRKREQIYQEARSWGLHVLNPVRVEEEEGETETAEDLSLDRDLGLDLDLEDIEDSENTTDIENQENIENSEELSDEEN
jgi:hypothetical protein